MGITARAARAVTSANAGAIIYMVLFAFGGIMSSLKMNLMPSARGWSSPEGPTLFGP